ncbi:exopolysaccharide biosynthesis polyprenyl glycosylphosphotransferase [Autumnicola musiva]|uniref:Exopolysaccharide biosynthesis polyprenyl glycosylphosphotransferase n=1 Tax=Autumnicola musiva TaxID=3075589 RepID=A0ABU3D850_9FLAO|nr:exopolysaccharide biosynthesis polyprenyl glycosylphosphotransferase [Zunongwangia sp. F117]MDT0677702.1 exopolysaccharide biosynthesis polyprenyl glycosylphosphotransferase [Zunongwangia sp. F117]
MKWSPLLIPFSIIAHLAIINSILGLFTPETYSYPLVILSCLLWLLLAIDSDFYTIKRKERFVTELPKFLRKFIIFMLAYFTVLAFMQTPFLPLRHLKILGMLFLVLILFRWSLFFLREQYRIEGGNYVNVVVIGKDKSLHQIKKVFERPDYGYRYKGYFDDSPDIAEQYHLGAISQSYRYINENDIDEIYCAVSRLSHADLKQLIRFSDNNFKKLKLIPDHKGIFTRAMEVEHYGTIPVINLRKSPLDNKIAKTGKRIFDIVFSGLVILLILTWLIPLLFFINKFQSKGPVLFKQLRNGHNKKPFWCYKFRSMALNTEANSTMCIRNDARVTRIGKMLRKTSIDELPQFINVFLGEMSVVGPRPHMETHTFHYQENVEKYLVRHFAKPGITGLAQVKGYRGEIVHKSDIINRTRFDIFYLEKWHPLMDFQIIYSTIANAIKGEEKAY